MPDKIIPIRFVTCAGTPATSTADSTQCIPVVDLVVLPFQSTDPATSPIRIALVDTGADCNYASSKVLDLIGGNPISTSTTHGVTGSSATSIYKCSLFFPYPGFYLDTELTVGDLHNRSYDIILGRPTLKMGILTLDYLANRHELIIKD